MNNNKKINFNEEINALFERLMAGRDKKLENFEEMKANVVAKLDKEIERLYVKKDLIANMWANRETLRLQRSSVLRNIMNNSLWMNLKYIISIPFIYSIIVPALFLHIIVEIYHRIAFRLYDIPRVKAQDYFVFDRSMLPYLNYWERFNCFYCSYFNCLISYVKEIAGRTERYWCPIKHSKQLKDPHSNYDTFVDYDDGETLRKTWDDIRKFEE
jgi:hypothetical protein